MRATLVIVFTSHLLVLVGLVHEGMRLDVAVEVIADKIVVSMLEDCVDEGREVALVAEGALWIAWKTFRRSGSISCLP
jgi:hypothetical protein